VLHLPETDDTIVGLATVPGRSALALIRISGPSAHEIARVMASPWPGSARAFTLARITDGSTGRLLDRGIVTRYDAPHSYTGDDLVELTVHGGSIVAATVIEALIENGARQATPGEFTRRAVLNGKLDIVQAEAIADLIDAKSRQAQSIALLQVEGNLSRRIEELKDSLLEIEALIAYEIDFPEEDDGPVPTDRILAACDTVIASLVDLQDTSSVGELVRDGALVVLAGAPNVGKSSLFNSILGQQRAIVTSVPGTTRDALEAVVDIDGWAVRLVDTAGLRSTREEVEQLGIEMTERYLDRAAIVLACGDSDVSLASLLALVEQRTSVPVIAVRTKWDLEPAREVKQIAAGYEYPIAADSSFSVVPVSSRTGRGLAVLLGAITDCLSAGNDFRSLDAPVLTRARHARAIAEAANALSEFRSVWVDHGIPPSIAATYLRTATLALEELIGVVQVDDILDRVFSSFCVGK
jgi:tRNA modification GTPase